MDSSRPSPSALAGAAAGGPAAPGRRRAGARSGAWLALLVVTGLAAIFFAAGLRRIEWVSREAVVCEAVCRELLANSTVGRQALVSSVWWPPLPVLLRMPLAALGAPAGWPAAASLLLSAAAGAGILLLLWRALGRWGLGPWRLPLLAALAANPLFLRECVSGSSALVAVGLLLLCSYAMAEWAAGREVRLLVYLALGAALLLWTSAELAPWVLILFVLLLVDLLARPAEPGQRGATLLLAFLPLLYLAGLWVLMNWLIMGDGFYFLRSLVAGTTVPASLFEDPMNTGVTYYLATVVSGVALAGCGLRRDRPGAFLGVLAVAPLALGLLLLARGYLWDTVPVLFSLVPLAYLAAGRLAAGESRRRPRLLILLMPLMVTVTALVETGFHPEMPAAPAPAAQIAAERDAWLPLIERHVRTQSRYPTVFVCGYDSFVLLGDRADPDLFVPSLDFNFNEARQAYRGHALYILVRQPHGRSGMDSVHWQYDGIFALGSRSTLYDGSWGDWHLFEIIQAAPPLPP